MIQLWLVDQLSCTTATGTVIKLSKLSYQSSKIDANNLFIPHVDIQSIQKQQQSTISQVCVFRLVVNGATFLHFKFIAYTLKGLTETSALVCLRSEDHRQSYNERKMEGQGSYPHTWNGGGGGQGSYPHTLMFGGKSPPPPFSPRLIYTIACERY